MYIKHFWVSYPGMDRFLIESNEVPKTHPNIKGLDVKYWLTNDNGVDYCLSVCDDDAILPGGNGVIQLSEEEWNNITLELISAQNQNSNTTQLSPEELNNMSDAERASATN
jgi:hypothetical protein